MTESPQEPPPSTEVVWPDATARLRGDPSFGPLVEEIGPVRLPPRRHTAFGSLAAQIIYQQLAGAAAKTIHDRFLNHFGPDGVEPATILAASDEALRGVGLSGSKAAAIRDLARKVEERALHLDRLDDLPEAEVVEQLTQVRGIGPWTAHMYLLFDLRRPDVWPVGDLGVRKGLERALGLSAIPTPEATRWIGTGYRPWRSALAWYCWRALEVMPPE